MARGYDYSPGETTADLVAQGRIPPGYIPADAYSGMTSTASSGGATVAPDLLTGVQNNLRAANAGELPADVQQMLAQRAAEIGVASGTSGSEFNKFRSLRDLGLTSLGRQDFATNALMGQFMTPYQQASLYQGYAHNTANDNAAFQQRAQGGWGPGPHGNATGMPTVPAAVVRPPAAAAPVGHPMFDAGNNNVNALVNDLFSKYARGGSGGGSAPMGAGTVPGTGVVDPWNAGPVGGGDQYQAGLEYQRAAETGWGQNSADPYSDWQAYS